MKAVSVKDRQNSAAESHSKNSMYMCMIPKLDLKSTPFFLSLKLQTCAFNSLLDISAGMSNRHNLNMFETELLILPLKHAPR